MCKHFQQPFSAKNRRFCCFAIVPELAPVPPPCIPHWLDLQFFHPLLISASYIISGCNSRDGLQLWPEPKPNLAGRLSRRRLFAARPGLI
jgi:hypothetical protein